MLVCSASLQLLDALCGTDDRLRLAIANYALPTVLKADGQLLGVLIEHVMVDADTSQSSACQPSEARTAALVAVLKVAKQLQLFRDLDQLPSTTGCEGGAAAPRRLLLAAVSSGSAVLRADALDMACAATK